MNEAIHHEFLRMYLRGYSTFIVDQQLKLNWGWGGWELEKTPVRSETIKLTSLQNDTTVPSRKAHVHICAKATSIMLRSVNISQNAFA